MKPMLDAIKNRRGKVVDQMSEKSPLMQKSQGGGLVEMIASLSDVEKQQIMEMLSGKVGDANESPEMEMSSSPEDDASNIEDSEGSKVSPSEAMAIDKEMALQNADGEDADLLSSVAESMYDRVDSQKNPSTLTAKVQQNLSKFMKGKNKG